MNDLPKPKRRWYRFTPDRFIVGLLAVEGFLLLSERLRWFAFNEKKGFTVLVAVAAVCLGVLFLFLWYAVSLLLRRRFQFGIRSLLVLVLAVGIPCSWLGVKLQKARRQREIVEAIRERTDWIFYDYQTNALTLAQAKPPVAVWLWEVFEDDFFCDVTSVSGQLEDEDMTLLAELTNLERLGLGGSQVTDTGLERLKGLVNLETLYLNGTGVTDSGVEHLKGLTSLEELWLDSMQVTDAGTVHLRGLTNLEELSLNAAQVTDVGLEHLEELTNLTHLYLKGTKVTDAGLQHLKGLTSLKGLALDGTLVTDAGVNELKKALPDCQIHH